MTNSAALLRHTAEQEARRLPALLAQANQLAGTVLLGEHGRRRSGMGDDFWQYRPMRAGDEPKHIDWRRSARGDDQFVREKEWQIAQSIQLWVDSGASMQFSSDAQYPLKAERARVVALAAAILLIRGGERVGLTGTGLPPRRGSVQIDRLAHAIEQNAQEEYQPPEARAMLPHARALFVSDFMGDIGPIEAALTKAADRGVTGVLMQILDPSEELFPFDGRTIFKSVGGTLSHETLKAGDLRGKYLQRLAERKEKLTSLCRLTGWQYHCHRTDASAQSALLWLYHAVGARV